jgi:hypothetical protein
MTGRPIDVVLAKHTDQLISLPGVVGTAVGERDGEACIRVLVESETAELVGRIPSTLEGYPVEIQETGEIRALGH